MFKINKSFFYPLIGFLFIIFSTNSCEKNKDKKDNIVEFTTKPCDAQLIMNQCFALVDSLLYHDVNDLVLPVSLVTSFMEDLTGIISESPRGHFGKWGVTKKDYHSWKNWYGQHQDSLSCDSNFVNLVSRWLEYDTEKE